MEKRINADVGLVTDSANKRNGGQLAFNSALETIQNICHELADMNISGTKKKQIGCILQSAISNAYKAGFVCGSNRPELTQNGFVSLMYDRDFHSVGGVILDDLQKLTLAARM